MSRRIFCLLLAFLMIFTAAPQVFAYTFDVGNDDQLASSWETASNNGDSENTFNMTNNIDMEGHTLNAESGKTYIINGNDHYIQNVEITGDSNSDVIINANVSSATDTALTVTGSSSAEVLVNGNVTTVTDQGPNDGETALQVSGANVSVVGDVGLAVAGGSTNMNASAVIADTGANVTISGDVYSAENGVNMNLGADVTIQQDLDVEGMGMVVTEDCTLTVEGDVNAGSGHVYGGDVVVGGDMTLDGNLYVSAGSVTMEEGTTLEATQIHIYNGSDVDVGFIEADRVTVGLTGGDDNDKSTLHSDTINNDASNSKLEAAGDAYVEVIGNADQVTAKNDAVVEIYGTADSTKKQDKAKITVNMGASHPEVEIPVAPSSSNARPAAQVDPIVKLCQGYDSMNGLYDQTEVLFDFLLMVERDLCAEMNVASAIWASLFSHNDILIDRILNVHEDADIYNASLYNADSVAQLQAVDKVNPYYVSTYKDTLAKAISDLNPEQIEASETDKEIIQAVFGLAGNASGNGYGYQLLSSNELKVLNRLLKDGKFTPADAEEFHLLRTDSVLDAASSKELADFVTLSKELAEKADFLAVLAQAGVSAVDFVAHLLGEYKSQIAYLDNILANESLSPALFVAAVDLRYEYSEKLAGAIKGFAEDAVHFGADWLLDKGIGNIITGGTWGLVNLGVDVFGFISGGSKDSNDLQTASAMPGIANMAMSTYIDAIRNVQNGDTSEEAIQQVKSSFVVLRTTFIKMCEIMTNIGDKQQEKNYRNMIETLETFKMGYEIAIP